MKFKPSGKYFQLIVMDDILKLYYIDGESRTYRTINEFDRTKCTSLENLSNLLKEDNIETFLSELFKFESGYHYTGINKFLSIVSSLYTEATNIDEFNNMSFIIPISASVIFDGYILYSKLDDIIRITCECSSTIIDINFNIKDLNIHEYTNDEAINKVFKEDVENRIILNFDRRLYIDITVEYINDIIEFTKKYLKIFRDLQPSNNTELRIKFTDDITKGVNYE